MFYIRGGGDGHGIGLSQYGAYGYALHGKDYKFILRHYYRGTSLARVGGRTVRVLLAGGGGPFSGVSRAGNKRLDPRKSYSVRPNADGTLSLVGANGKQIGRFASPLTVSGPGAVSLAGSLYRGAIEFRAGSGGLQVIERVGLEDYVRGVISAEIPAGWSAEALKAQAVAARTYAITTKAGGATFDVYPDTRSQMYRGVAAETAATDAAVAATRGQVVTYSGRPVVTYFFNSSGGHTENIEDVWSGSQPQPWLKGVNDPYDDAGGDPYHRWGQQMSPAAAAAKLGSLVKGSLRGIQVVQHGSSPRVLRAEVVGTRGRSSVSGSDLQHTFGELTTYMEFTTISTYSGRGATRRPGGSRSSAEARAVTALVPLVDQLVSNSVPGIHGSVFPVQRGAKVVVQRLERGRWRRVAAVSQDSRGAYAVELPGPGSYRISYHGVSGPSVRLG
ncbi:MAG: SpoIID/LytB domain-containing protein [Solirubrobacterales bacterium]|nr:SpoIID/LytB domain-containing protein [Solirubrobacterales bacterium]